MSNCFFFCQRDIVRLIFFLVPVQGVVLLVNVVYLAGIREVYYE